MHPLAPYPSPEARDHLTSRVAVSLGAEICRYGLSVQGRPLLAVRVPSARARAPKVLVTGNIHGVEFISGQVVLGLLQRLTSWPVLRELHEQAEIWAIPCLNPDAYARVYEAEGEGRVAQLRPNANGVDLNRNFPLPSGHIRKRRPGAGSLRSGDATYIGSAPLSEPESQALAQLLGQGGFCAATNGHSFMGKVIPPRVLTRYHWRGYKRLAAALRGAQPHCRYGRLATLVLDTFTGELEDYQHHHHGMWSVCLETFSFLASFRQHVLAPSLFWRFNPHDLEPWVENDVPGIASFLLAALRTPFAAPEQD